MEPEAVLKFHTPSTFIVCGQSGVGTSWYVHRVLKSSNGMFKTPPSKIIYCYNIYQDLYDRMKQDVANIQFFEDLPSRTDLETWSAKDEHCVLILDDLMSKCSASQEICDLFTTFSHHMNISVFFIVQHIFSAGKAFRTISLNAHFFMIFKNK